MKNKTEGSVSKLRNDGYWDALLNDVETRNTQYVNNQPLGESVLVSSENQHKSPPLTDEEQVLWDEASEAFDKHQKFELIPIGFNKGGLIVRWRGLNGFVPASQLDEYPHFQSENERMEYLAQRQRALIKVCLIEVVPDSRRLIFSERIAKQDFEERKTMWQEIAVGDVYKGRVTNMTDFGAFVDIGGLEGLIHISELSWSRVYHPKDILQPDQDINCMVIDIDRDQERISLSLKRTTSDPWADIENRYKLGQLVKGTIREVKNYGVFVTLEDQLEGLLHQSEILGTGTSFNLETAKADQPIEAWIMAVNGKNRRIALTLQNPDSATPTES